MASGSRRGDAPAVGYPEWERSRDGRDHQAPETGQWDLRQERWIPVQRMPDGGVPQDLKAQLSEHYIE